MLAAGSVRAKVLGELMFQGARLFSTCILTAYRILFGWTAPAVIMVLDDANGRTLDQFGQRMNLRVISLQPSIQSRNWGTFEPDLSLRSKRGQPGLPQHWKSAGESQPRREARSR